MYTFNTSLFMRFMVSLEGLRRGQAGALGIGIFISYDTLTAQKTALYLLRLEELANMITVLLSELPDWATWAWTPWLDYSSALT